MRKNLPSKTALQVGMNLIFLSQDERIAALLPPGSLEWTERLLKAAGYLDERRHAQLLSPRMRRFSAFMERHTIQGQQLNAGLRKCFMEDETREALASGATQVLVAGAGFDTLAPRLAVEFPETTFVEIDHPATQKPKRGALDELGELRPNLHLASVDLASTSLAQALDELGVWRRDAMSVVVTEAVLMYLEEAVVAGFFDTLHDHTGPGSRLLFTYMCRDEDGRLLLGKRTGLLRWLFRMYGEPVLWAARAGELASFLERHGHRLLDAERCDLHRRYLEPAGLGHLPLGGVELMAVAERNPTGS